MVPPPFSLHAWLDAHCRPVWPVVIVIYIDGICGCKTEAHVLGLAVCIAQFVPMKGR
jgi:hypothetical protein